MEPAEAQTAPQPAAAQPAMDATQAAEKSAGAPSEKRKPAAPAKLAKSAFSQAFKGFIARGLPDQNQRFETTDESRGPSGSSESRKSALPESAEISMPITHNFKLLSACALGTKFANM